MNKLYRISMYCIGLLILALGIVMNTKTGLGVSPIISIPYSISEIFGINLGNATLCIYILCILGQIALRGKRFRTYDLLQLPMSVVFSRIINFFNDILTANSNNLAMNLIMLAPSNHAYRDRDDYFG